MKERKIERSNTCLSAYLVEYESANLKLGVGDCDESPL